MLAQDRHHLLLTRLEEEGSLKIQGLAQELGVNGMTLWRDFNLMERRGLLKRVHGGAIRLNRGIEPTFDLKSQQSLAAKRAIAARAVRKFVRPGDVIIMEGGTTIAEMLRHLPPRDLTILTNGLSVLGRAHALGRGWEIHGCGGTLRPVSGTFVGPDAVNYFTRHYAVTFFMSATGLDLESGKITDPSPIEIEVKRAMAKAAKRVVVLLDASKLNVRSVQEIIPLSQVHALVTDARDRASKRRLAALGVTVA